MPAANNIVLVFAISTVAVSSAIVALEILTAPSSSYAGKLPLAVVSKTTSLAPAASIPSPNEKVIPSTEATEKAVCQR